MIFMNEWDVQDAERYLSDDPVLGPAIQTLRNLVDWTNANSDGWAYWPKPCRAAARLQTLISRHGRFKSNPDDVTAADIRAALRPIKAFRTRQGADFVIVEP